MKEFIFLKKDNKTLKPYMLFHIKFPGDPVRVFESNIQFI